MKNGLIIDHNGTKSWWINDKLHHVDGPAVEWTNGAERWYLHGKLHRVDGPTITYPDGFKFWYLHGKLHRVDGPAITYLDGSTFWWLNGKRHRVDGPAEEWVNGAKRWWLHDKTLIRPKEFKNMEEWFDQLNTDEKYSLPWINDINGIIEVIKNPTTKQKRLHAMKWKL